MVSSRLKIIKKTKKQLITEQLFDGKKVDTLSQKNKEDAEENFNSVVSDLRKHIGITFHRYINGDQRKISSKSMVLIANHMIHSLVKNQPHCQQKK